MSQLLTLSVVQLAPITATNLPVPMHARLRVIIISPLDQQPFVAQHFRHTPRWCCLFTPGQGTSAKAWEACMKHTVRNIFSAALKPAGAVQKPTAVAVAAQRNLLIVGSTGHIATYDVATTVRQALVALPGGHTPRLMQLTPSGNHLLVACSEWTIYHVALKTMKPALILSLKDTKKRPLESPLMAFMGAFPDTSRVPVLFVTNRLKDSVRAAYLAPSVTAEATNDGGGEGGAAAASGGAGKGGKTKSSTDQHVKLPLEKGKGAMALASNPFGPVLYVLTVNGELQLYQHVQGGTALQPLHQFTSAYAVFPASRQRLLPILRVQTAIAVRCRIT